MLLGSTALPLAAVEPIVGTPLPAEPPATILPNLVIDALAFDLDGDGVRELLTVGVAADAPGLAALQAWWVDADGSAEPSNQVHVRRSASVDELRGGQRGLLGIDRDQMIAVRIDEPAKLLVMKRDGREVALLAAIGVNPDFDRPCCLTLWEIGLVAPAAVKLRLVAETARSALELIAADMDADLTDELVVTEGPPSFSEPVDVGLLRWDGDAYSRTGLTIPNLPGCCAKVMDVGESDGLPGEEVLLGASGVGPDASLGLYRLTLRVGGPHVERSEVGEVHGGVTAARMVPLEGGPAVVVATELGVLFLWSWPSDASAELVSGSGRSSGGIPLAVQGMGSGARIVVASPIRPVSVLVLPGDLGSGAGPSVLIGRDLRFAPVMGNVSVDEVDGLQPYFGMAPDGLGGGSTAYIFSGRLVRPVADLQVVAETEEIALLPGLEPVATVGPSSARVAVLEGFTGFDPASVATSLERVHEPAQLRLVATASVLEPEEDGGHLEPTFFGVAPDPDRPMLLLVGSEAAEAEIVGPAGTAVWWWSTRGGLGESSIGSDGVGRVRLLDAAGPNANDGSGATITIWLVTPAGHAYAATWRIQVYRQPPALLIADEGQVFNLSPTVSGETVPGATVTVNGVPAEVADDGSFEAPVVVGVLPSDVRVVATDPVGNRTERVVSVVWPFDYRRLPFVPFAVLLTVVAALVLFLRRPDTGPGRHTPDDGATFEEIGG